MKKHLRIITTLITVTALLLFMFPFPVSAATMADVTITFTPQYIAIATNTASYDFGTQATSATPSTPTGYFGIDNTSSVAIDVAIGVTGANWTGGVEYVHDDTGTPGANTVAMLANAGGIWETGDVIVKYASPNDIVNDQAANTDFVFGIKLLAPTSYTDNAQKTNTVRLTATAH